MIPVTQKPNPDNVQALADAVQEQLNSPAHLADHTSFKLIGLLNDMYRASPDDQPHERFSRLCHLVLEAFGDGNISDEAVAQNPVTPLVMTYLLRAFEDYAERDERGDCRKTADRSSALAEAMLMSGGTKHSGKKATIWTLPFQIDVVSAGRDAYNDFMWESETNDDDARAMALKAAIKAACHQARCRPDGTVRDFNSGERRATRAKVVRLLAEHGYKDWSALEGKS